MATHLDLEEQEQLDQLKHFWKQYGNAITRVTTLVLLVVAVWMGYQAWRNKQAMQAAALFEEVEKVVRSGETEKMERVFADMKEKFGATTYASQTGLVVAKALHASNKNDAAQNALAWVAENGSDQGYASLAKLRLSALLMETKAYDEALKTLSGSVAEPFVALVADRRGDIYVQQGKSQEAKAEYEKAWQALSDASDYRQIVRVKLDALGGDAMEAGK